MSMLYKKQTIERINTGYYKKDDLIPTELELAKKYNYKMAQMSLAWL